MDMLDCHSNGGKLKKSAVHKASFEEWTSWVQDYPIKGMTWMDRLYWEQRVGAWAKNAHQMLDMFDSVRIMPANCQMLTEYLIAFDPAYNTPNGKEAQKDIIRLCSPELASIPYGDKGYFTYKTIRKIKRVIRH